MKIGVTNRRTLNKNRLVAHCVWVLFIELRKNDQKCKYHNLVRVFNQCHLANFIFANLISISILNWENSKKNTTPETYKVNVSESQIKSVSTKDYLSGILILNKEERDKWKQQPPRGVPRKRRSENMQEIYRIIPMPKCDFNKVEISDNINFSSWKPSHQSFSLCQVFHYRYSEASVQRRF